MESSALPYLKDAEKALKEEQTDTPSREGAIALTHLQTAILWLENPRLGAPRK